MDARDIERMLGAVLGGGARSPRRRTTQARTAGYSAPRSMNSVLAMVLGVGAKAVVDYMTRKPSSEPAPSSRPQDLQPGPARSVPQGGHSPWGQTTEQAPQAQGPSSDTAEPLLLLRVAIAAAKADGVLDAEERAHIAAQLDSAGLVERERDFVLNDLQNPITIEEIARSVRDPMLAAQAYATAFATMDAIEAPERDWLNRLATKLRLDAPAITAIEARLAPSAPGNA